MAWASVASTSSLYSTRASLVAKRGSLSRSPRPSAVNTAVAEAGVEADSAIHLSSIVRYVPRGLALSEVLPWRWRTVLSSA